MWSVLFVMCPCFDAVSGCVFAVEATKDSEWRNIKHELDEHDRLVADLNAQVHGKFSRCVDNTYDDRRSCRVSIQLAQCRFETTKRRLLISCSRLRRPRRARTARLQLISIASARSVYHTERICRSACGSRPGG